MLSFQWYYSRQHQEFFHFTRANTYMPSNEFARHNNNKKNKEISRSGLSLPVEYLLNGKRYSRFVLTLAKCKGHATKRCNPRLCCCYRFWDIVVANIKNFKIFDFDVKFARATWYMPSNEFARHNNKKNKEISRSGLLLPVEYLRNGKRYSSFVFTVANGKSHATKRCKLRLCCCYRFWDIVVANIKNFKIFDFDVKFARATWYMPSNEFARHNYGFGLNIEQNERKFKWRQKIMLFSRPQLNNLNSFFSRFFSVR